MQRSAQQVLDDHLHLSQPGTVEEDLRRNYAEDVVILCMLGVRRGPAGLKELAQRLEHELPVAWFEYRTVLVDAELAFLGACPPQGGCVTEPTPT